ncbi:hypothetical protein PINS_up008661 [Pythium insidiosum]|nr:hypothetical protein PINS_up008661 [Pythium insidiosum]
MDDINEAFLDTLDTLTSIRDGESGCPLASTATRDAVEAGDLRLSALSVDELSSDDDEFEIEDLNDASRARMNTDRIPMEAETSIITSNCPRASGGSREEDEEHIDQVSQLEDIVLPMSTQNTEGLNSFYQESLLKASQRSDGTDRSLSFASECTDLSPLQSPHGALAVGEESNARTDSRPDDSTVDRATNSVSMGELDNHVHSAEALKQFAIDGVAHFDQHFGRSIFLEELGRSFVDGSGSKSLASYRLSSMQRISQNKSGVLKQGWLMKRGEFVPSWHKRWFTLRRMPQGPLLTYAKDNSENAPAKAIEMGSTSRCVPASKPCKDHEFRIITSADSSRREYAVFATSNYEMSEWVRAIQSAINAGNKSTFEGSSDLQRIWNETGIQGFLVRYGMRKVSVRHHLQTRVLEINFADQTITNSRRGESLTTLHFNDLVKVTTTTMAQSGEEFGAVFDFSGKHRSWPIFLDTSQARDDLVDIAQKIINKDYTGNDLERRCSRLRLKSGFLERRNVGPQATLKGKLFVCLYENSVVFYPDETGVQNGARPWYVATLRGLKVSCNEGKCLLGVGRLLLTCASSSECREWYAAIMAAVSLPHQLIEGELKERVKIRNVFHNSVFRLRKLLKAHVKPEVNGPPKDQKTIDLMIRKLWELTFPGEPFTSNADPRWQELGFQRGGPASDLRSSGLLGLYCLIYFVTYPSGEFQRILDRTRFGVSEGNMKNYPLAIGCINVVAILTETIGFGDAGSHSEGCSPNATKTFVRLLANTVTTIPAEESRSSAVEKPLDTFSNWEDIVDEAENHVFEDIFCILYPILDGLFVEMGAGYMEFGQVVNAFRRRVSVIFDSLPKTIEQLKDLAAEPFTAEVLVEPSIVAKAGVGR